MKIAQSFRYKEATVVIKIDPIRNTAIIKYMGKERTIKSMDINFLHYYAQDLVDLEVDDNLYNTGT